MQTERKCIAYMVNCCFCFFNMIFSPINTNTITLALKLMLSVPYLYLQN